MLVAMEYGVLYMQIRFMFESRYKSWPTLLQMDATPSAWLSYLFQTESPSVTTSNLLVPNGGDSEFLLCNYTVTLQNNTSADIFSN